MFPMKISANCEMPVVSVVHPRFSAKHSCLKKILCDGSHLCMLCGLRRSRLSGLGRTSAAQKSQNDAEKPTFWREI